MSIPASQGIIFRVFFEGKGQKWSIALPYVCTTTWNDYNHPAKDFEHFYLNDWGSAWENCQSNDVFQMGCTLTNMVKGSCYPLRVDSFASASERQGVQLSAASSWHMTYVLFGYSTDSASPGSPLLVSKTYLGPPYGSGGLLANIVNPSERANLNALCAAAVAFTGNDSGKAWLRVIDTRKNVGDVLHPLSSWESRPYAVSRRSRAVGNRGD